MLPLVLVAVEVDRAILVLRCLSTLRGAWSMLLQVPLLRAKESPLSVREGAKPNPLDLRPEESLLSDLDGTRLLREAVEALRSEASDSPRLGARRGDWGRTSILSDDVGRRPPRRVGELGGRSGVLSSHETARRGFRVGKSPCGKDDSLQEADRVALLL